jgi:murein tripeptide amidase MpaA
LVGCIHGNESAGIGVARLVVNRRPPGEANVWVIPDLNPDGVIAGTRQNAMAST